MENIFSTKSVAAPQDMIRSKVDLLYKQFRSNSLDY